MDVTEVPVKKDKEVKFKEAEVQTTVELPDKVTVTWVPVAENMAAVRDGDWDSEEDGEFDERPGTRTA